MYEWLFWIPALMSLFLPFITLRFIFKNEMAEAKAGEEACLKAAWPPCAQRQARQNKK